MVFIGKSSPFLALIQLSEIWWFTQTLLEGATGAQNAPRLSRLAAAAPCCTLREKGPVSTFLGYPPAIKHGMLEKEPLINDFPINTSIYMGFSVAMFDYWRLLDVTWYNHGKSWERLDFHRWQIMESVTMENGCTLGYQPWHVDDPWWGINYVKTNNLIVGKPTREVV